MNVTGSSYCISAAAFTGYSPDITGYSRLEPDVNRDSPDFTISRPAVNVSNERHVSTQSPITKYVV